MYNFRCQCFRNRTFVGCSTILVLWLVAILFGKTKQEQAKKKLNSMR